MHTETEQLTIAIVDRQLDAYNARDIDAFAATYHEDVEIHSFSKGLQYTGRDTLIERYGKKFASLTYLNATSLKRIVHDRFLVDHELAESSSLASGEVETSLKVIAAYEVEDGLIKRVTFMG
ncbi:nuclear transport factor 2 family protein [Vibrio penaeicida]|uniref:nuclear transport factor 2 family protein n=1 Tax=Vibrio penaeicida TaxID=104609 RepID=UPI000CEA5173|nr:nuclear transport factor 2 family protein [Vibrio penaeicida]